MGESVGGMVKPWFVGFRAVAGLGWPVWLGVLLALAPATLAGAGDASTSPEAGSGGEATGAEAGAGMPFAPTEKLTYALRWGVFNVGEAVMEVNGPLEHADMAELLWHFKLSVRTTAAIDPLYKVRTVIQSWTDLGLNRTRYYEKSQLEGDTHRDIEVSFDWEGEPPQALYTNWDRPEPPCPLEPGGTFDPLGATYRFRTVEAEPGTQELIHVTDGKKLVDAGIAVREVAFVRTPLAAFEAIRVNPELGEVGGVFQKSPDAAMDIWLSNDEYRVPVKVSSRVVVGSFSAVLTGIEIAGEKGIPEGMAVTDEMPVNRRSYHRR